MERKKEAEQWNLLLVNEWNAIPDGFEVDTAEVEDGYVIDERVRDVLRKMLADCRDAGHSPMIVSTYRTREKQQYLYDHTANKADTAAPGHSEHECGLAADIIDAGSKEWSHPLTEAQEDMPAQKWLMEHSWEYGFVLRYPPEKKALTGIIYEPWHYRYVGRTVAEVMKKEDLCFEEFLSKYGNSTPRDGSDFASGGPES